MADVVTNAFLEGQALSEINFNTDTFKCALVHILPRPDDSVFYTLQNYSQISANEVPQGNGYNTFGTSITTSAYVDPATNDVVYSCSSPQWIASGGTIGPFNYGIFYDVTATNTVIYVYDFLKDYSANDGAVAEITIDVNGLIRAKRSCPA